MFKLMRLLTLTLGILIIQSATANAQVGGVMIIDNCDVGMKIRDADLFVEKIQDIYQTHLGRAPDSPGFHFYACHFAKENVTISEIENYVANSPEANQRRAQIKRKKQSRRRSRAYRYRPRRSVR